MGDHLDVPLEDAALLEEVELISALMIAASEAEGKLDGPEVDRLLGIGDRAGDRAAEGAPDHTPTTGSEERPTS